MRLQIIWPLPPPPTSFWSWPLAQCCRHTGPVFQAPLFPKSSVYPVLLLPLTQLTPSLFNTFSLKALSTVDDRYLFVCGRACIFCSARLCASALTTPQKAQPVCLFQLCTLHPAPAPYPAPSTSSVSAHCYRNTKESRNYTYWTPCPSLI